MVTLLSAVQSCTIFLSLFTIICVSALFHFHFQGMDGCRLWEWGCSSCSQFHFHFLFTFKEWAGADSESGCVQVVPDPAHNSYRLGTLCLSHRHWGNKWRQCCKVGQTVKTNCIKTSISQMRLLKWGILAKSLISEIYNLDSRHIPPGRTH